MADPVRCTRLRPALISRLGVVLLTAALTSCTTAPPAELAVNLDRPATQFSLGRVTFVLVDEYGISLPGMQVSLSWEEPSFHKTSAFTNREGTVRFSGVPQVAEVSVYHPGGIYTSTFIVPQTGQPEMRLMLDTMGAGEQMRERERAMRAPRTQAATP